MKFSKLAVFLLIVAFAAGCAKKGNLPNTAQDIAFGVLPVMQALPLFIAQEKGYYDQSVINVKVVPFNTAAEKDIAMSTGNIVGQFADLFTPVVIEGNGRNITIVATNYNTTFDRRMFAVLASPKSSFVAVSNLAGIPIGLSSNTVLDYVTETLLVRGGLPIDQVERVEVKNIGMRFQMLMSGQIQAATLPEPLVTAAVAQGATVIVDDAGFAASQTVLLFTDEFAQQHPKEIKAFLVAVQKAQNFINEHPDSTRTYMVKYVRLPDPLKDKYPVPRFPPLTVPGEKEMTEAVDWLHQKGAIPKILTYKDLVDGSFLP